MIVGSLAGAVWAVGVRWTGLAAGMNIIVISLIANYLADGVAKLLTARVVGDPDAYGVVVTRPVPADSMLPLVALQGGLRAGFVVALVVAVAAVIMLDRAVWGHRLRMFGLNPDFAALAGTEPHRYSHRVAAVGGALCGLAGALEVLSVFGRYLDGPLGGAASPAWLGVMLAVLVPRSAVLLVPGAVLLAMLQTGFTSVQRDVGVAGSLGILIQAAVLLSVAFASRARAAAR
jgi:simple sugar transport system permease protein